MDDRFEWADYPPQHVGPLAPPGAQLVENPSRTDLDGDVELKDIDKCEDIDECADGSESEDDFLDDGTDIFVLIRL